MFDRGAPGKGKQRRLKLARKEDLQAVTPAEREAFVQTLDDYGKSLKKPLDFKLLDCARRLGAGTGSLGTPRFYLLIHDRAGDGERILGVKRLVHPTGYAFLDPAQQADLNARLAFVAATAVGQRQTRLRLQSRGLSVGAAVRVSD